MKVFGPVPSRRLGRSMGINNMPPKLCTYSCVYCQLGRTLRMEVERTPFYEPREIHQETEEKVVKTRVNGHRIDYLTFVADGEPTLDINLGREIDLLRPLGIKVAVITNGSLISRADVREELAQADWVSLKVDCTREEVWRKINRPERTLQLDAILEGMLDFAVDFEGELVTETMLVQGINTEHDHLEKTADFLVRLQPTKTYLSVPTRPPAEKWVKSPDEVNLNAAYQIFAERLNTVEYLIDFEGSDFTLTGDPLEDILSITAVHPMREDALKQFLFQAGADWSIIDGLIEQGRLIELDHQRNKFYLRRFANRHRS